MTIKLNSLERWTRLKAGEAVVFEGSEVGERRVRLNLNLEAVTSLFIGSEKDGERFLVTTGPGLETVEFNCAGTFKVYAEKGSGQVYYQSADLEPTFSEVLDPVIFTRIANRRHRNPELEEIMYRMQNNMERRLAQQSAEMETALERRMRALNNEHETKVISDAPGAVANAGSDEVPEPVEPAVKQPAPKPPKPATGAKDEPEATNPADA